MSLNPTPLRSTRLEYKMMVKIIGRPFSHQMSFAALQSIYMGDSYFYKWEWNSVPYLGGGRLPTEVSMFTFS